MQTPTTQDDVTQICSNDNHTSKRSFDLLEQDAKQLEYTNKVILAPMVRVGTLPFRLLALEVGLFYNFVDLQYGADIVFSEEIIALKLRQSKMIQNKSVGTIDFIKDGKESVFRTCHLDHPNILQLGAADPIVALQAAEMVSPFVDGIDLNMGCPKHFSIQGGMGAALLSKPQTVKEILSTLQRNLKNPVSCKIRLLDTVPETLDLLKIIDQTGVSAITIHTRHIAERPRDPAHWDWMKEITDLAKSCIRAPLIINGDIFKHADIKLAKEKTGASSVMIARGAMWNASIFRPIPEPIDDVITNYLKKCVAVDNNFFNTKYVVMQMLQGLPKKHEKDEFVTRVKDMKTLCEGWNLQAVYEQQKELLQKHSEDDDQKESCYDNATGNENSKKIKTG